MNRIKKKVVIATSQPRNEYLIQVLRDYGVSEVHLITRKEDMNENYLNELRPDWIFVPHWSYIIPANLAEKFLIVIFHMTDLPYGRGGSPLQNLILNGRESTSISAIRCTQELDAGPVYLKKILSLNGSAEEILIRASSVMGQMMIEILNTDPIPQPQRGEVVQFRRRRPEESQIQLSSWSGLDEAYDFIRMLDGDGYPRAFIQDGGWKLELDRVHRRNGYLEGQFRLSFKEESDGN